MSILYAQAILGLTIMPDKYRVLVGRDNEICQRGVLDYTLDQLMNELKTLDRPEWIKQNIIDYFHEARKD